MAEAMMAHTPLCQVPSLAADDLEHGLVLRRELHWPQTHLVSPSVGYAPASTQLAGTACSLPTVLLPAVSVPLDKLYSTPQTCEEAEGADKTDTNRQWTLYRLAARQVTCLLMIFKKDTVLDTGWIPAVIEIG